MIIGGGMAYTFLKVINNINIGKSLFDTEVSSSIMCQPTVYWILFFRPRLSTAYNLSNTGHSCIYI